MATRRDELLSRLKNNLAFASKAAGLNVTSGNTPNMSTTNTSTASKEAVNGMYAQYSSRSPNHLEDNHQLSMADGRNFRMNPSEQSDVDMLRRLDDGSSRSIYPQQRPVPVEQKSDNFMQSVMSFLSPQYRPAESISGQNRNISPEYEAHSKHISARRFSGDSGGPSSLEMDNYSDIRRDANKLIIDNFNYDTAPQRSASPDVTFANNQRSSGPSRINIMRPSVNVPHNHLADAPNRSLDRGFDSSLRYNHSSSSNLSSGMIDTRQNEPIRRPISPNSRNESIRRRISPDSQNEPIRRTISPDSRNEPIRRPISPDSRNEPIRRAISPDSRNEPIRRPVSPDSRNEPIRRPISHDSRNEPIRRPMSPDLRNEPIRRRISPNSSFPERNAPAIVKSQLSNDEREQMVSAMEEMHSNVTMLDEALTNLKQMRERMMDRPPNEQRDALLRENSRMQDEINSQLSALRQAAKEIADELLEDVAKLVTGQRPLTNPAKDIGSTHQSYTRNVSGTTSQQLMDTVDSRLQLKRDQLAPPTNLLKSDASVVQLSYIDNGTNKKSYTEDGLPRRSYADDFSRELHTEKIVPAKQHDSDLDDFAIKAAMQQSNLIFAAMNQHKKQKPQEEIRDDREQRITTLDKQRTRNSPLRSSREKYSPNNNTTDERRSYSAARDTLHGRKRSRDRSAEKRNNSKNNHRSVSKTRNKSRRSRSRVRCISSSSSVSSAKSLSRHQLKRERRNRSDSRGLRDRSRNRSASRDRSRRKDASKGRGRDRSRSKRRRSVSRDRARSSSRGRGNSRSRRSRNRSSGRRDSGSRLREKVAKPRSKSQLRAEKEKADAQVKADAGQKALKLKAEKERAALEMIITLYMNAESYYDAGNLWCKKCCCILIDLPDLCKHLHSEDHLRKIDQNFDVKRPAVVEKISGAMAPARGDEFLLPMVSFFCSLCCDFSKDRNQAEAHIKSVEHNKKFKEFLKENSGYELQFLKDKSSALLAHAEEKNVICCDSPPINNNSSKDTVTSKASDKFQIKFTGSLKQASNILAKNKPSALLDDKDDDDDDMEQTEKQTDRLIHKTKPADLQVNFIPLPVTTGSLTGNNRKLVTTSSAVSLKLSSSTSTKVSASSVKSTTRPNPKLGAVTLYRPSPTRESHVSKAENSPKHDLANSTKSGLLASHILFSIPQDEDLHTPMLSRGGANDGGWQLSALRAPAVTLPTKGVVENKPPAWTLLPPPSLGKVNRAPALRINPGSTGYVKPVVAHLSGIRPPPRMP